MNYVHVNEIQLFEEVDMIRIFENSCCSLPLIRKTGDQNVLRFTCLTLADFGKTFKFSVDCALTIPYAFGASVSSSRVP